VLAYQPPQNEARASFPLRPVLRSNRFLAFHRSVVFDATVLFIGKALLSWPPSSSRLGLATCKNPFSPDSPARFLQWANPSESSHHVGGCPLFVFFFFFDTRLRFFVVGFGGRSQWIFARPGPSYYGFPIDLNLERKRVAPSVSVGNVASDLDEINPFHHVVSFCACMTFFFCIFRASLPSDFCHCFVFSVSPSDAALVRFDLVG